VPRVEDAIREVETIATQLLTSGTIVQLLQVIFSGSCRHKPQSLLDPDTSCVTVVTAAILQSSSLKDLHQWSDPLAAIVMYTFDLSMLSKGLEQEKNFYFRLNKVSKITPISSQCRACVFMTENY
jgi:hypothetical protein